MSGPIVHPNSLISLNIQAIFVDLKPDPINILGIAKITRSPSQQDKGPWFYVDARKTPIFIEVSRDEVLI